MNDKMLDFIKTIGVISETWGVTYKSFLNQGFEPNDALIHTKLLIETMMESMINGGGKENGTN
jgi:hypothetical protein